MTDTQEKPPKGTYPNHIEKVRLKKGIERGPIQKALGISQTAFLNLIDGRVKLSLDKAIIISTVLRCRPSELSDEIKELVEKEGVQIYSSSELVRRYIEVEAAYATGLISKGKNLSDALLTAIKEDMAIVIGSDVQNNIFPPRAKYSEIAIQFLERHKTNLAKHPKPPKSR